MSEEGTGDLAGIGKIAEAIPEAGWQKAIDTACDTFTDLIAPITKTTAGLGGLIQAKFDAMVWAATIRSISLIAPQERLSENHLSTLGPTTRAGKSLLAGRPRLCARTSTTFPLA